MSEKIDSFNRKYNLELYFPENCASIFILNNYTEKFKATVNGIVSSNNSNVQLLRDLAEIVEEVKAFVLSTKESLVESDRQCKSIESDIQGMLSTF